METNNFKVEYKSSELIAILSKKGAFQIVVFSDDDNRLEKSDFHNRRQAIAQSAETSTAIICLKVRTT